MVNNKYSNVLILLLLFLVVIAIRIPDISMPLERDEGEYALAARQILRGEMPYTDSYCQKPPVVFIWYLLGFMLSGETAEGIHLIMFIAAALAAFGMYLLLMELLRQMKAENDVSLSDRCKGFAVAALFAVASSGSGYFGAAANTEIFMLAPLLYGTWLLLKMKVSATNFRWFMFGFCLAASVMTKQVALFSFLGPVLWTAFHMFRHKTMRLSGIGVFIGGIAAFVLPIISWLWFRGALYDFVRETFLYNLGYVGFPFGLDKWLMVLQVIVDRFKTDAVLWINVPLFAMVAAFDKTQRNAPHVWFGMLWFVSSIFGVALGPFPYAHYFLQILPPLCLITGLLLNYILTHEKISKAVRYGIVVIVISSLILPMLFSRVATARLSINERSAQLYRTYEPPTFVAAVEVGRLIKQLTSPQDRILVVGSEPEILFYADRRSATRYTIFYPLTGSYAPADRMTHGLFAEIRSNPPKMIVLTLCKKSYFTGTGRLEMIMAEITPLLRQQYMEVDLIGADPKGNLFGRNSTPDFWKKAFPLFQIFVAL